MLSAKRRQINAAVYVTRSFTAHSSIRKCIGIWIINSIVKENIVVSRVIKLIRNSLKFMRKVNQDHLVFKLGHFNSKLKCLYKLSKADLQQELRSWITIMLLNKIALPLSYRRTSSNNVTSLLSFLREWVNAINLGLVIILMKFMVLLQTPS